MNKYRIVIIGAFLLSLLSFTSVKAQDNILYNMRHLPQYNRDNVARQPDCNVYVGIPAISGAYLNFVHTGFTFKDLIIPDPNHVDSFMIDLDGLESALNQKNFLSMNAEVALIDFGFRFRNDYYLTFAINNKTNINFQYPRSLVEARAGNYRTDNTPLNFMFGMDMTNYTETAVGLSKEFYNNMTFGLRVKLLSGNANMDLQNLGVDWYTNADEFYDYRFVTDMNIRTANIAGGADVSKLSAGDTAAFNAFADELENSMEAFGDKVSNNDSIMGFATSLWMGQNKGLGFDIGFDYQYTKQWNFSLAINDLGYIKWKTNPMQVSHTGEFDFSGVDLGKYINSIDAATGETQSLVDAFTTDMTDSLLNFVSQGEFSNEVYKTSLTSKLYAGATYSATKWLDLGFLYKGMLYKKTLLNSATLSANASFFKGWAFTMSYSVMDGLYNNIGLGLTSKLGPFQFYIVSDNIAAPFWAINDGDMAEKWIRNTKRVTTHFGLNFTICGGKSDFPLLD